MLDLSAATESDLPRLLYLSGVPVEASYHGSALLYRLLERYPADRLCIVEAGLSLSSNLLRLKGVRYESHRLPFARLAYTRFSRLYWSTLLLFADSRAQRFTRLARDFRPQAILTIADGTAFITAANLGSRIGIPLHLICHDAWRISAAFCDDACKDRIFGRIYRAAASRLCVSPFMVEEYERRYHARGSVLYPLRQVEALTFPQPPDRLASTNRKFVCAFAGNLYPENIAALKLLADCLARLGGRVLIFAPGDLETLKSMGLSAPNVEFGGFLTSRSLIQTLRERADALFVPMSFSPADRANMEIGFPSKLTDYSAVGLPLLIYGPQYCSAVRWAKNNAPMAEVVTTEGVDELSLSLRRLASDPEYRMRLARSTIAAGDRFFSYEAGWQKFSAVMRAAAATGPAESPSQLQAVSA
jgi:glycosyltransferase involved in cell wall biosynthesis